jgi:hypothetical protein
MKRARWSGRRGTRSGRGVARDWRDSGDIQDSNAATVTGAGDGARREPTMDWTISTWAGLSSASV